MFTFPSLKLSIILGNGILYSYGSNGLFSSGKSKFPLNDSNDKNKKDVDLFFIFGPNVFSSNMPFGSMARTKVEHYVYPRDYPVFRECVKTALRAALIKMIDRNIDVAILPRVSGGIYSDPDTREVINSEYPSIINKILDEIVAGDKTIREYFKYVILTV